MTESGIYKLLGEKIKNPSSANGIPRCELYIKCENPEKKFCIWKKSEEQSFLMPKKGIGEILFLTEPIMTEIFWHFILNFCCNFN